MRGRLLKKGLGAICSEDEKDFRLTPEKEEQVALLWKCFEFLSLEVRYPRPQCLKVLATGRKSPREPPQLFPKAKTTTHAPNWLNT